MRPLGQSRLGLVLDYGSQGDAGRGVESGWARQSDSEGVVARLSRCDVGGYRRSKDWDRRGERKGMPRVKEIKTNAGAQEQPAGETITNGMNRRKWTEGGESVRGRKKIGSNWDRQASGVRAGNGNRWTSRHGIGSVRAQGRMDRLQLKLIGRALSLSSVLSVSHVNSVRPDQIRSAPMLLLAGLSRLLSQSLPTTTLFVCRDLDNLIQAIGRGT